jgi:hydrogenase nickel incorporation protein HypB
MVQVVGFGGSGVFAVPTVLGAGTLLQPRAKGRPSVRGAEVTQIGKLTPPRVAAARPATASGCRPICHCVRATRAPAVQINTGKGCHLDAHMVGHALNQLPLTPGGLLFIENVGNLVCPAAFDLGEAHKVVVLSVTEGEDKPLSIPRCSLGPT